MLIRPHRAEGLAAFLSFVRQHDRKLQQLNDAARADNALCTHRGVLACSSSPLAPSLTCLLAAYHQMWTPPGTPPRAGNGCQSSRADHASRTTLLLGRAALAGV
jgi:hypothetical protein